MSATTSEPKTLELGLKTIRIWWSIDFLKSELKFSLKESHRGKQSVQPNAKAGPRSRENCTFNKKIIDLNADAMTMSREQTGIEG
jgi:hypothetical protein